MLFVIINRNGSDVTLRELLNSGAGASLIASHACEKSTWDYGEAEWATVAGNFRTFGTVKQRFKIPEMSSTAIVDYMLHIAHTLGVYDLILGRYILKDLGIIIDFSDETVVWN